MFATGHTGFKGRWLTVLLELLKCDVYGISVQNKKNQKLNYEINFLKKKNSYLFDLRNLEKTRKIINKIKPDIIFHLAAQSKVLDGYKDLYKTFDTNFMSTLNILSISNEIKNLKTVLVTTTDKVYENNEKKKYFKENDKLGGDDPYSGSKSACEILVKSYRNITNINLICARAGNVIGGGDWVDNRILPDIFKSFFKKKKLIVRNPKSIRPWQYVVDIIYGYLKLVENSCKKNKKNLNEINVGYFQSKISVMDLIKLVNRHVKIGISVKKRNNKLEKNYLYLNLNYFKKLLKIKKFKRIEDIIPRTVELYNKIYKLKNTNDIKKVYIEEIKSYLNEKI